MDRTQNSGPLIGDTPIEEVERALAVNVVGVWKCMIAELAPMVEAGHGVIINTASETALRSAPRLAAYASIKAAVVQISRTAAAEYGEHGIRLHPLCPRPIDTPMLEDMLAARRAQLAAAVPLGRLGTSDEVAQVVLWLCAPASPTSTACRCMSTATKPRDRLPAWPAGPIARPASASRARTSSPNIRSTTSTPGARQEAPAVAGTGSRVACRAGAAAGRTQKTVRCRWTGMPRAPTQRTSQKRQYEH
jgi:Enoyl-(Acyl carrier protein) reductase